MRFKTAVIVFAYLAAAVIVLVVDEAGHAAEPRPVAIQCGYQAGAINAALMFRNMGTDPKFAYDSALRYFDQPTDVDKAWAKHMVNEVYFNARYAGIDEFDRTSLIRQCENPKHFEALK